jgi:peptidoglycan/xylan/chitin deacetylase (PgdA/CDA1 family)
VNGNLSQTCDDRACDVVVRPARFAIRAFPIMQRYVLAYHSHRVLGNDYADNDHVALATDLQLVHGAGGRIVSLDRIVDGLHDRDEEPAIDQGLQVALTFDDGPMYDAVDFEHPRFGPQRGFLNILRDFTGIHGRDAQPELHATSFVIASPDARKRMESTYDPAHSYVGPGALDDDWWLPAIKTGLLAIASHSFDHLHHGLSKVAHSAQVRGDFTKVSSVDDADAQIAVAGECIDRRTGGRRAPYFAYPFGHYNTFLTNDYLPAHAARLRLRAAFTTDAKPIAKGDNVWCLPRYVCGHHWKQPDGLRAILTARSA